MFKWIGNAIWGSSNKKIIKVDGVLFEFKQRPACVFPDCTIIVDKSDSTALDHYISVVPKDVNDNETGELRFPLDESLQFSVVTNCGDTAAYCWRGEGEDADKWYIFRFDDTTEATIQMFEQLVSESLYESCNQTTSSGATQEDLDSFIDAIPIPFDLDTLNFIPSVAGSSPLLEAAPAKKAPQPSTPTKPMTPVKSATPQQQLPQTPTTPTTSATVARTPSSTPKTKQSTPAKTPSTPAASSSSIYPTRPVASPLPGCKRFDNEREIMRTTGDLYLFDALTSIFNIQHQNAHVIIARVGNPKDFLSMLFVETENGDRVFGQPINSQMYLQSYQEHHSIVWSLPSPFTTWSIVFKDVDEELDFKDQMAACMYEAQTQQPFENVKAEDREWITQATVVDDEVEDEGIQEDEMVDFVQPASNQPIVIDDDEEEEEDEEEDESESEEEEEVVRKATRGSIRTGSLASTSRSPAKTQRGAKNSLLVDSYRHNRAFVVRGPSIGVFKHQDLEDAEFDHMIEGISTLGGDTFTPSKAMLHYQDSSLLLLPPGRDSEGHGTVYKMDLERGEVVEEWKTEYTPIREILPLRKYAQQTQENIVVGLNGVSAFGIDPRTKTKIVGGAALTTQKAGHSCAATTESGALAVASKTGEIRLYSGVPNVPKRSDNRKVEPKTAKTLLPGFGDPVKGIDVTADGHWVLTTCDRYLLVIPTQMPDSDKLGFEVRMGQNKPKPRRLQLSPEDVAALGGTINFSPARFNTGCDGETWIVTSTGSTLIQWNFRKVQQNQLNHYTMKRVGSRVMDETFVSVRADQPGSNAPVIVALPDDVRLEKRTKTSANPFKAATRTMRYTAPDE